MSHEDSEDKQAQELDALRANWPVEVEEASPGRSVARIPYSIGLAERICSHYIQGKSLHWIAAHLGEMPAYQTILKWSKNHPDFSKMLRSVREARALHFEDAAIEAAEAATGKDADRLKFEAYKWGAEVNDPGTYGKKVTHSGDAGAPIILQVVTGFGPPNPWQTPPKLKADGTIDVEGSVIHEHPPEPLLGPGDEPDGPPEAPRDSAASPGPAGHADAPGVRGGGDLDGL